MTHQDLSKILFDNGVYDAYQFINNSHKQIITSCYCRDVILSLIKRMGDEHQQWQNELFNKFNEQNSPMRKIELTGNGMPSFTLSVCDVETTAPFLLDKLTKDFFQYARNAFDCMSQAANVACLATRAKKIESVDFNRMKKVFEQQTYSQAFPDISLWYNSVGNSAEYQYLDAFNNRTKHICDIYLKMSMAIIGEHNETSINPFYKRGQQHNKQDISGFLSSIYDFISSCYKDFLTALLKEIPKQTFVENRYHSINIYQQKFLNQPQSSFSMPYIDLISDISSMPETIQVLFVKEVEGNINARNCPVDTIYIKGPGDFEYVGKYVAEDSCGDDTLLQYRKYKKIPYNKGTDLPLCYQAMNDPKQKDIFYHKNAFMNIKTISDDDDFLKRVQLPF